MRSTHKPLVALLRLSVSLMALAVVAVSCRPNLSNFNSAEKKKITSAVWLHRTSRDVVSVADKDGMALVYGNVRRVDYEKGGRDFLLVAYEPVSSATQSTNAPTTAEVKVARIDLKSAQVVAVPDPDGTISKSLESVDAFFP
jgi:hypothetical protein